MTQHLLAAALPSTPSKSIRRFPRGPPSPRKAIPQPHRRSRRHSQADLAAIASGRRMRIYGNLPYYITSPILHHLFTFAGLIDEIHIVIQTEVCSSPRGPTGHARLRLSFRRHPSSTRVPNLSSKFLATRSSRRRKSPPPSSRSACPANAQSSPSAPAPRQPQARRRTHPSTTHLVSWIL